LKAYLIFEVVYGLSYLCMYLFTTPMMRISTLYWLFANHVVCADIF